MSDKLINRLTTFIIRLFYHMTVNLAVELLKFGLILVIIGVLCASIVSTLMMSVFWMYTKSDGSLTASAGAFCVCTLVMVTLGYAAQYLTRDVLRITDMSLPTLLIFLMRAVWTSGRVGDNPCSHDNNSSHTENILIKKKM